MADSNELRCTQDGVTRTERSRVASRETDKHPLLKSPLYKDGVRCVSLPAAGVRERMHGARQEL